jgi:hypothetical protein
MAHIRVRNFGFRPGCMPGLTDSIRGYLVDPKVMPKKAKETAYFDVHVAERTGRPIMSQKAQPEVVTVGPSMNRI